MPEALEAGCVRGPRQAALRASSAMRSSLGFMRSMRMALATTIRQVPVSAKTAIHMVALPVSARSAKMILTPMAKAMFSTSKPWVMRERRTSVAIDEILSSITAMWAASMALSVPRTPMAMPMSARASAGASLMPSPAMAVRPLF